MEFRSLNATRHFSLEDAFQSEMLGTLDFGLFRRFSVDPEGVVLALLNGARQSRRDQRRT
jgi:hypothetical protein